MVSTKCWELHLRTAQADGRDLFCSNEAGWITGQVVIADGGMGLLDPAVPLEIQLPALQPV